MILLTPGFIMLAFISVIGGILIMKAQAEMTRAQMDLTADELKTFNERFRFAKSRADMPPGFTHIAQVSDRLRRRALSTTIAVIAGIAAIIFVGPGL